MNKSNINEQSAGTEADNDSKDQNQHVSQPNANTNVVGSLFSQREIKFRAWDKRANTMIKSDFVILGQNGIVYISDETNSRDYITLLQFTGLKDREGKNIYEGDLCRVAHNGLCQIFWDEKRARFGVKWLDKTFKSIRGEVEMIFNNHEITFEVIGNIFENPELLQTL